MSCQFDFFAIQATSPRVTDLTKAGVERNKIETKCKWVQYGPRWFQKKTYIASLGFVDCAGVGHDAASKKATELALEWQAKGVKATVKFYPVD